MIIYQSKSNFYPVFAGIFNNSFNSTPREYLFSYAGLVMTNKRTQLSPNTLIISLINLYIKGVLTHLPQWDWLVVENWDTAQVLRSIEQKWIKMEININQYLQIRIYCAILTNQCYSMKKKDGIGMVT